MSKRLRIYVAGPYSAKTADKKRQNVNNAIDAAIALYRKGHFPFIPHLTHFVDKRAGLLPRPLKYKDYIQWDEKWLSVCDGLLFLGHSPGADHELKYAKRMHKQIFYSLEEVPSVPRRGR